MKTKKTLMALLALATISFLAMGLASCGGNSDNTTSEPPITHTHEWNEYVSKQATCDEKGVKTKFSPL